MAIEGPPTFYAGLPRYGQFMDEQWGMFRDDFNALAPIARATYVDKNSISGEDDLAGLAIGELDFRNRYRVFYDKTEDEYRIQYNQGTEDAPSWTTYVKIRDEDGRFTVSSDGGLESTAGFYNFDYLTIFTHGISGGYSKDMVNRFAANRLDGFYWSDDSTGAPVLNLETPGGSGEANTATSLGDVDVYKEKSGVDLKFRGLTAGSNISLTQGANDITVASTASGGGGGFYGVLFKETEAGGYSERDDELNFDSNWFYLVSNGSGKPVVSWVATSAGEANTGSSLGDVDVFKQKAGVDLEFRGLTEGANITLTQGANDITIASTATGGGGGFYGITVKHDDGTASFSGIEVIAVEAENFYLTQNSPNTDEVLINFRGATGAQGEKGDTGDTGAAGADGDSFYGMVIKDTVGYQSFEGINVLAFHSDDFYLSQQDTDTAIVNARPVAGGGSGETNTASNLAGDEGVYASKSGSDLRFKSLTAGANISLASDGNAITITGGAGGSIAVEETNFYYKDGAPYTDASASKMVFDHNFYLTSNPDGDTLVSLFQGDSGGSFRSPKWAGCSKFGSTSAAVNITWDHTTYAGPNRALFVFLTKMHDAAERIPNRVTYAGIDMRLMHVAGIEGSGTTDPMGFCYAITGQPIGTHPIIVDWGASVGAYACIAANYIHVNQAAPVITTVSDTNNTGSTIADAAPLTGTWWKSDRSTLITCVGAGHAASKTYTPNSPAGMEQRAQKDSGATATTEVEMVVGDVVLPTAYVDAATETQWTISASEENYIIGLEVQAATSGAMAGATYQGRLVIPEVFGGTDATAETDNSPWPMITHAADQRTGFTFLGTKNISFLLDGKLVMDLEADQLDGTKDTTNLNAKFGKFLADSGGTVSAPVFIDDGDTNTGMWFPASDRVSLAAGGRGLFHVQNITNDWVEVAGSAQAQFRGLLVHAGNAKTASYEPSDTDLLHVEDGGMSVEGRVNAYGIGSRVICDGGFYSRQFGELPSKHVEPFASTQEVNITHTLGNNALCYQVYSGSMGYSPQKVYIGDTTADFYFSEAIAGKVVLIG